MRPKRGKKYSSPHSNFFAAQEAKLKAAQKKRGGKKPQKKAAQPPKPKRDKEKKEEEKEEVSVIAKVVVGDDKETEEEEEVLAVEEVQEETEVEKVLEDRKRKVRRPRLTDITMQKDGGLCIRLSRDVEHWPVEAPFYKGRNPKCPLHRYLLEINVRRNIVDCETCSVALCPLCFKLYHTEERMVKKKQLAAELKTSWLEHHPGKEFPGSNTT